MERAVERATERSSERQGERFVEQMGLAAEADGFTRIAGRLFGALLLSDGPRSLDELADALGVSKASVSTDARRLLERGVVERVGRPGDRRDYYQLAPDFFGRLIRHRVARWTALHRHVVEMRRAAPEQPRTVRDRFDYIDAVHEFVLARVEEALRQWDEGAPHASKRPAARKGGRGAGSRPRPRGRSARTMERSADRTTRGERVG
jgi:DNA-binding transcriptional regulator GbsR (MarR family)